MAEVSPITRADIAVLSDNYQTVRRWLRGKQPDTSINYARYMIQFNRATGQSPDDFLAWAKTVDPGEVQDLIEKVAEPFSPSIKFNFKVEMRSFLRTNGFNSLPKASLSYTVTDWHRGYKREEVKNLLGYLDSPLHKLYVYLGIETGLRAKTILSIRYKHIKQDYESGIVPVAIRFGPEYYNKAKAAGFTFLGEQSVKLLRECIEKKLVETKPESRIIPRNYPGIFKAVERAKQKAGLDQQIQVNHGLRKYFENALDKAELDVDQKHLIEGHFAGTRAKHYTGREWDDLRELYVHAYPHINVDSAGPELEQKLGAQERKNVELSQRIDNLEAMIRDLLKKEKDGQ